MTEFLDRLTELTWTSPEGNEFKPLWDSVSRQSGRKAPVTELPQEDNPIVQDLGNEAIRYPMDLYFSGAEYDTTADEFWDALGERGESTLSHPRWGDITVMVLSREQSEEFVSGVGMAKFKVEFVKVRDEGEPVLDPFSIASDIAAVIDKTSTLVTTYGNRLLIALTPAVFGQILNLRARITDSATVLRRSLSGLANAAGGLRNEFYSTLSLFDSATSTFSSNPTAFTSAVFRLCRGLARSSESSVAVKTAAFRACLDGFLAFTPDGSAVDAETVQAVRTAAFTGLYESVVSGDIATRSDGVDSALDLLYARDAYFASVSAVDATGAGIIPDNDTLQALRDNLSLALSVLYARASLQVVESIVRLDNEATPLDLCYKLYGSLDNLETFIAQNTLSGTEFLLLPIGREIRYYR